MIQVFCDTDSPRLRYTLEIIFKEVLQIEYAITSEPVKSNHPDDIILNYSNSEIDNSIRILPVGLLSQHEILEINPTPGKWDNLPVLFANDDEHIPFDLFSAVFYLVSRYEEYLLFNGDQYGRFEANESIASKNNFLNIPIVELWCKKLAQRLKIQDQCPGIKPENYNFLLTIDIDQAWVYKNKGILKNTAALIRDLLTLKFNALTDRLLVITGLKPDPGYTYKTFFNTSSELKNGLCYFILSNHKGKYDPNISIKNKNFRNLIRHLDETGNIGIHPSYRSNENIEYLEQEFTNLQNVLNRKILSSRQHYLMLKFPDTFENLIRLGIHSDYSLGYAAQTGFRAGIARPFNFYNLVKNEQTNLRIVPFQVMDRTLLSYLKMTPEKAIEEFRYYTETIKRVGGTFVALWHNTSICNCGEWKGWKKVFDKMIALNS